MSIASNEQEQLSVKLNGKWSFALDPEDEQKWNELQQTIPENAIQVPGSWEEQGYGASSFHYPIGTWKKDHEYEGAAWYVKEIVIPDTFNEKKIYLILKGVRWMTEVWVDGRFVGKGDSISIPHSFELTSYVQAGKKHRLVIKVDNRMNFDLHESHIHSYHTSTYWGGITGGVELQAVPRHSFRMIRIEADTEQKSIDLQIEINRAGCQDKSGWSLSARVFQQDGNVVAGDEKKLEENNKTGSIVNQVLKLELGKDVELWSPDNPYLYQVDLTLYHQGEVYDKKQMPFGLRTIRTAKNQVLLNNQPIFLAGYVDCCIFPQTGYPVWDIEHFKKQFRIAKSYGFNHVRLHGWNAPEPFWQAANEEGMLVQTELPHWSLHYRTRPIESPTEVHSFLKRELEKIITALHIHPSFAMLSMGNELISEEGHPQLNELVRYARELDPTRIYTDNTGFGELPANDREGDYYTPTLNWHPPYNIDHAAHPNTTLDYSEVTRLADKPLIAHEHGQFTMYVRPDEAQKYEGVLRPHWLETVNETLKAKGFEKRIDEFTEATGIHLVRSLKETLEKARRTPGLSGIQLLDIRDFPGQGHATVGILDVFWDTKNIVEPAYFRQFNSQTILVMRAKKRTYYCNEALRADLEVSHFGSPAENGELKWVLTADMETIMEETTESQRIEGNGLNRLLQIEVPLPEGKTGEFVLQAELELDGKVYRNQWSFWVFPSLKLPENHQRIWTNIDSLRSNLYGARVENTLGINQHSYQEDKDVDLAITDQLSRDILQYLIDGGNVWMMAKENYQHDEVFTKYLPIFWNYLWFPEQRGTTMGMKIHEHPALQNFPTDGFSNWHWYHLVDNSIALNLDLIPKVKPIIEVIDNFNRAKRLAYAFEVRVGKGKLFVSTLHFTNKQTMKLPEVRSLFLEFANYVNSDHFQPEETMSVGELLGIFKVKSLYKLQY